MSETVSALDRDLELFAAPDQQTPLKAPRSSSPGWDKLGIHTVQSLL